MPVLHTYRSKEGHYILEHLAGMYSSGEVTMTCEELEEYRADDKRNDRLPVNALLKNVSRG